jgi:hypothetical protein
VGQHAILPSWGIRRDWRCSITVIGALGWGIEGKWERGGNCRLPIADLKDNNVGLWPFNRQLAIGNRQFISPSYYPARTWRYIVRHGLQFHRH